MAYSTRTRALVPDPTCTPQDYPPGSWLCHRNGGTQIYLNVPTVIGTETDYPYLGEGIVVVLMGLVIGAVGYALGND